MNEELHIYVSPCCKVECAKIRDAPVIRKDSPGVTTYYYDQCTACNGLCHPVVDKIYDSSGVEVKIGDIVECPRVSEDHSSRWHAAYEEYGHICIRDLGHNNSGMYQIDGPYYTRGHYSKHLDKLDDDDLDYYWGVKRCDIEAPT